MGLLVSPWFPCRPAVARPGRWPAHARNLLNGPAMPARHPVGEAAPFTAPPATPRTTRTMPPAAPHAVASDLEAPDRPGPSVTRRTPQSTKTLQQVWQSPPCDGLDRPETGRERVPPLCLPVCGPDEQSAARPAHAGARPIVGDSAAADGPRTATRAVDSYQRGRGMQSEDRLRHARQAVAVVGVDCGRETHTLVIRPQVGPDAHKTGKPLEFPVTAAGFRKAERHIRAAVRAAAGDEVDPGSVLVGAEFGGTAGMTLARYLADRGYDVVSVRPADTKDLTRVVHRRSIKTDAKDAEVICRLASDGHYLGFPFLHPDYAELRLLVTAIDRATKARSAAVARLRGALHIAWPEYERTFKRFTQRRGPLAILALYPSPAALLAAPRDAVIEAVRRETNGQRGEVLVDQLIEGARESIALPSAHGAAYAELPFLLEQIALANRQRADLEARLAAIVDTLPEAAALMTIPGVAALTAGVFLGSVGDVRAYEAAGQVLALAGLNLTEYSSGKHTGKPHISKQGRPMMRRYLYLAASRLVAEGKPYHAWHQAALARNGGLGKKSVIAVARKVLRTMYALCRSGEAYDPGHAGTRRVGPPAGSASVAADGLAT